MRALLTGITGNLGYEVALDLIKRSVVVVPLVRAENVETLSSYPQTFKESIATDLLEDDEITYSGDIDCIVHCAGIVHFRDATDKNEQMMRKVIKFAQKRAVPVHFASTAFVYRPDGTNAEFNNSYEEDKFQSEELLRLTTVPYSILRPSVLVGNSKTGAIRNFNGYYLIVKAFLAAAKAAQAQSRVLRFPTMPGRSDIVPVDQAAERIGNAVMNSRFETLYITNPQPPLASWVLAETLNFFGLQNTVEILDVPFGEFGTLSLTNEETLLYRFAQNFSPYWSMEYRFPDSDCTENLIDSEYMKRVLSVFRDTLPVSHA